LIVHNEHYTAQVMSLPAACNIDYYTLWEHAQGKGHETEPHLGRGSFVILNGVLMIAFQEEGPSAALIDSIRSANAEIQRRADHIRLFQLPLEPMV
jgi:hypothetical protein